MVVFACTDSQYNFNAMVYYIDKVKPDKGHGFEYDDHGLYVSLTCCLPDHPGHWWSLCDWLLSRKCLLVTLSLSLSLGQDNRDNRLPPGHPGCSVTRTKHIQMSDGQICRMYTVR